MSQDRSSTFGPIHQGKYWLISSWAPFPSQKPIEEFEASTTPAIGSSFYLRGFVRAGGLKNWSAQVHAVKCDGSTMKGVSIVESCMEPNDGADGAVLLAIFRKLASLRSLLRGEIQLDAKGLKIHDYRMGSIVG